MATSIKGLERLQRKLAALPQVAKDEMRKAIGASADEMVAMAQSLVPVETGALRGSIGWTWGEAPKGSLAIGAIKGGDLTATIYAGTRNKSLGPGDAFYARWIEFGTVKMAKQPFFFVSYRALRKRAKNRIRRSQRTAAKKVAGS